MRYQKKYRGGGAWHEISEREVIAQTEKRGWAEPGTVLRILAGGEEFRTPYADFRDADIKPKWRLPYGCRAYVRRVR